MRIRQFSVWTLILLVCGVALTQPAHADTKRKPLRAVQRALQGVEAQPPSGSDSGQKLQFQLTEGNSLLHSAAGPAAGNLAGGPTLAVDVERLADLLEERLNGKCVGWQFAIFKNAQLAVERAGGKARNAADEPARSMSTSDRLEIASCSKTINAIATLKVLEEKRLSIDTSIGPYVPKSWPKHASIDGVTFRQLLSHKSGLKTTDDMVQYEKVPGKWNLGIKSRIELGVADPTKAKNYENLNYAFLRVLVPNITVPQQLAAVEHDAVAHETLCAEKFENIVRNKVFVPAGLGQNVYCKDWHPSGANYKYAMYYDFGKPNAAGIENEDTGNGGGPGGWTVTARQLAQVVAAWNAGHLLSPGMLAKMKQFEMGIFETSWNEYGKCYTHNGGFSSGGKGGGSRLIAFPGNVQVALIYNSKGNGFGSSFDVIQECYEQAAGQSDLVITSLERTGPAAFQDGFWHIPISLTVKNKGNGVPEFPFANALKFGSDWRWSKFMDPLEPGKSAKASGTVKIKDAAKKHAGRTIELAAQCDAPITAADTSIQPFARVKEANESNNTASLSVKLPGGLDLASPTRDDPPVPGGTKPKRTSGKQQPKPTPLRLERGNLRRVP